MSLDNSILGLNRLISTNLSLLKMAPEEGSREKPSDAPELSRREDGTDPSTATSSQHEPESKLESSGGEEIQATPSTAPSPAHQEPEWAHGFQLVTILIAVTFVSFLMLLDGTIVVAAVPYITNEFDSLNDIGWYGAVYQLGRHVNSAFGGTMSECETDMLAAPSFSHLQERYI